MQVDGRDLGEVLLQDLETCRMEHEDFDAEIPTWYGYTTTMDVSSISRVRPLGAAMLCSRLQQPGVSHRLSLATCEASAAWILL